MGDRYELNLDCAYCGVTNYDIWYAPTSNSDTFECKSCEKVNFITPDFRAIKIELTTADMIREGFLNTTNQSWTEEQLKEITLERLQAIQRK